MGKRGSSSGMGAGNSFSRIIGVSFQEGLSPQQVDSLVSKLADERTRVKQEWKSKLDKLSSQVKSGEIKISDMDKHMTEINDWYGKAMDEINDVNRRIINEYGIGL